MAIQYVVVTKGNPANPTAPKKFYAQARSSGEVALRQIAKEISDMSTVSTIDTMAVLEALLQLIPKHLADGPDASGCAWENLAVLVSPLAATARKPKTGSLPV